MRIPVTMCHGISLKSPDKPLTAEHFDRLMKIAAEMGFASIHYDDLEAWRSRGGALPERPILIDVDHPVRSVRYEIHDVLSRHGFTGTLFIDTGRMDGPEETMTWEEIGELVDAGWGIGAHTVNHPNLSELSLEDPEGEKIRDELARCDEAIREHLGIQPRDFAFTGTSFSTVAQREVAKRYRFGRLWITQAYYQVDGQKIRYADLVGVAGDDEADGGPPMAARYIYRDTDPYLLPSMELQRLIYDPDDFRAYLAGSLTDDGASQ